MPKRRIATAGEFTPKPSRWRRDEQTKDEHQLFIIAILVLIATGTILYIGLSGMADAFVDWAANVIVWLRSA